MVIKTLPVPSTKSAVNNRQPPNRQQLQAHSASGPFNGRPEPSEQHRLPDAADLRRMCIMTKTDLSRIYENLERRQRDKDAVRHEIERKQEMAERSAQLTKQWPNTIIGARERKLELKKIREQEEEEKKKVLDIEEEKLAADRRREHIEKAKQLQYYETDKVKTFHGALLLGEVLKERDLQIEMKKRIEQMRETDEADVRQRFQEAQNEFHKAEQERNEQKAKDRHQLAQYHLAQADNRKNQTANEREKDRREGDEYRRLAEQNALEQLELDRFRKTTQQDVRQMYDRALEMKHKVKQMEQEMDEEEDEELRIYAGAKKKIARLRREKELQAQQEKQEARDHMIGYLGSLQKRAEADYDTQIFRAQAKKEAKDKSEEQYKLDKQQKMQEAITRHRHEAMKRREAEREMDERDDAEIRRKKAEADHLFQLYQLEKDKQRSQNAQALSEHHLKQTDERKERQRGLKASEFDEVQLDKQMNEIEKKQFQDYAERVISCMEENGRNTYPMKKVLSEEMKRYEQFNQGYKKSESTGANGEKPGSKDRKTLNETKKHLGFEWEMPKTE